MFLPIGLPIRLQGVNLLFHRPAHARSRMAPYGILIRGIALELTGADTLAEAEVITLWSRQYASDLLPWPGRDHIAVARIGIQGSRWLNSFTVATC